MGHKVVLRLKSKVSIPEPPENPLLNKEILQEKLQFNEITLEKIKSIWRLNT